MIDKSTECYRSTHFVDSIVSIRFHLKARFDNESSRNKDSLKIQIHGAVDATNDEESNEIGEVLSALHDVARHICDDEENGGSFLESTELGLRLDKPFYFCVDPIDKEVEVRDVTCLD